MLRIKQLTVLLCFIVLFSSCEKEKGGTVFDTFIDINLVNQQGQNLLAPGGVIHKNNIIVSHIKNGKTIVYNNPYLDSANGFMLFDNKVVHLFPNIDKEEHLPVTIIKFGDFEADTLTCEVERKNGGNLTRVVKIWYNGVLRYSVKDRIGFDKGKTLTIVK